MRVYFEGSSTTWEMTGTMKQEDLSKLFLQGFAVKGRKGYSEPETSYQIGEVQYLGVFNGFYNTATSDGWKAYYTQPTSTGGAAGDAKYYVLSDQATAYFDYSSKRTKEEVDFRLVLVDDTIYLWLDDVLSWRIPLTVDCFGGFEPGSEYELAISVDKKLDKDGNVVAGTVVFDNLKVKYGEAANTEGTPKFTVKTNTVDTVDNIAGLVERTHENRAKAQKLTFAGTDADNRSTQWKASGTMYLKDADINKVKMGFTVGNGEKEMTFYGSNVGFIESPGWSFDYSSMTDTSKEYIFNEDIKAFFRQDVRTKTEIEFTALIEDDILYVYFEGVLSWKIPLTEAAFGGFKEGTAYEFGVAFNSGEDGTAGFKNLRVVPETEILTDEDFFIRDPYVLVDEGTYYMYGSRYSECIDVFTSTDMITWEKQVPCFEPDDDFWGITSEFWAPEVHKYTNPDNGETAYYMLATFRGDETTRVRKRGTAILKADSPLGPFKEWSVDSADETKYGPVTMTDVYCLDGTLYVEDGVPYMIFSVEYSDTDDGIGKMYYVQLSNDLKKAVADPVFMFRGQNKLLGLLPGIGDGSDYNYNGVTEGPQMYKAADGTLLLLWSGGVNADGSDLHPYAQMQAKSSNGKLVGATWSLDDDYSVLYGLTDNYYDGGHGMVFTDTEGEQHLILHTPSVVNYQGHTARHRIMDVVYNPLAKWLQVGDLSIDLALNEEVKTELTGKNISILGDSISTYIGYSNNSETNSTITKNSVYYGSANTISLSSVEQTWWKQTATKYGMNVLVNNSAAGSRVQNSPDEARLSGIERCTNLHQDTTSPVVNPDIIAVFMGTNDFLTYVDLGTYSETLHTSLITDNGDGTYTYATPITFAEAYVIMMDKMKKQYAGADIFCFTLLEGAVLNGTGYPAYENSKYKVEEYCEVIKQVAAYYGAEVVDLYNESGITVDTHDEMTRDNVHPNVLGMDAISYVFEEALIKKYGSSN